MEMIFYLCHRAEILLFNNNIEIFVPLSIRDINCLFRRKILAFNEIYIQVFYFLL